MTMSIVEAAINLGVALGLSAVIGFERQWRNRLAGLRTNSLVSLGAASFVIFAALVPGEASPTRVAAQVVSGIGFLGAGLIFREGLNVRGLNTAATLWCSAAIGVLAGAGYLLFATLATGFVVFVNLLLRPIVTFINRQPLSSTELDMGYVVSVTCRSPDEAHVRALLLQGLAGCGLGLRRLDSNDLDAAGRVVVTAAVTASHRVDAEVEKIVGRLSLASASCAKGARTRALGRDTSALPLTRWRSSRWPMRRPRRFLFTMSNSPVSFLPARFASGFFLPSFSLRRCRP